MLYVPVDFENNLTVDALVDSGAFVSAIAQDDLETIKQKAPNDILKIDDPPNFQIQVANGQLEKPLSTATLKFEVGDNCFVEHFVVMKKLTGPIIGLHFMRNNSVVIDTTHGLIHFPHLTMQAKTASSETTTKPQPDLTANLNELLRTNEPEQQDNTFWFPTPENPGKPEDHTPIQTRILKELKELKDKEKFNPQESIESRNKFLKRFDWTDRLLTETEKQAIEDNLVEYHDIFARHRMDMGMNTEFKVKLAPEDGKAVYSQSLPMPIHLKEHLIVELALMQKYGMITVLPFPSTQVPYLHKGIPTENYVSLWTYEKSTV